MHTYCNRRARRKSLTGVATVTKEGGASRRVNWRSSTISLAVMARKDFEIFAFLTSYVVNVFYCLTTHTDLCVKHFSQYTLMDNTILEIILNHSVRHPRINNNHNARFTLLRLQCVCSAYFFRAHVNGLKHSYCTWLRSVSAFHERCICSSEEIVFAALHAKN